jgi:hypothetical protein
VDAVGAEGSRWYLEDFLDYPVNPVPMIAARTGSQLARIETEVVGAGVRHPGRPAPAVAGL